MDGSLQRSLTLTATLLAAILLVAAFTSQIGHSAQMPAVSIDSLSMSVDEEGTVNLLALKMPSPGLAVWTIDVSYDPAVVAAVDCAASGGFAVCNRAFGPNTVRFSGISVAGIEGDTTLGTISFACASSGTSGLSITLVTFDDAAAGNPQPIAANVVEGSIACSGGPGIDEDGDGCSDVQELGFDPTVGGLRDPNDFWDFFDTNRDRSVSILDFFDLLQRFGATGDASIDPLSDPPPAPAYHPRFDRGPVTGANSWNVAPADGAIAVTDFFTLLSQFGHTCLS